MENRKKIQQFEDPFEQSQNPQSAYRRRQKKLVTISCAWRCAADAQNHQHPEPRESGKNLDFVPEETRETPFNECSKEWSSIFYLAFQTLQAENYEKSKIALVSGNLGFESHGFQRLTA